MFIQQQDKYYINRFDEVQLKKYVKTFFILKTWNPEWKKHLFSFDPISATIPQNQQCS